MDAKVNRSSLAESAESGARLQIKQAARRLIAARGVHTVTVREIAQAAGQRNQGVVAYYFTTKDNLVAEILIDGAARIEAHRKDFLRQLESTGGPRTLIEAVEAIVLPSAAFSDDDPIYGDSFNRFLLQLSLSKSDLVDSTLAGRWNSGYQRCLTHMRRLLPHLSRAEQSRRFVFLGSYVSGLLAQREAMLSDTGRPHPTWRSPDTLNDIVRTAAALLEA